MKRATVTLSSDQARALRSALQVGLASFAEIERIGDELELAKLCGQAPAITLRHPTGSAETLGEMVDALRFLEACEAEASS